jgi:pyridoxamine 5'-phosphate oxidase
MTIQTSILYEPNIPANPLQWVQLWLNEAAAKIPKDPNAMTLSTANAQGVISSRTVLLKGLDSDLVFFTNYQSHKAQDLDQNSQAALLFYWPELDRQIRIEGSITKTSAAESDQYFSSRPIESQLSAAISAQSRSISSREAMIEELNSMREQYKNQSIPRPKHWGGYRLTPRSIEFWEAGPFRLHHRRFLTKKGSEWISEWLYP